MGNVELIKLLTVIEENFQKIFFSPHTSFSNFGTSLDTVYLHFFNYLPQFLANGMKGISIVSEDKIDVEIAYKLGLEVGYFYQFAIFSYILTAIRNQGLKDTIKESLGKVSKMLQYVSFEFIENHTFTISNALKIKKIHNEFLLLTEFHSKEVGKIIDSQQLSKKQKEFFMSSLNSLK
mmetsp:Transcript_16901/g.26002  ORF Transcript_16901/g.26002 Transcript_16901/m.26002 type:complete len:178 (+) Transcript_16901:887-1420(+)